MRMPCYQHDSFQPGCGDCVDMNQPAKRETRQQKLHRERMERTYGDDGWKNSESDDNMAEE